MSEYGPGNPAPGSSLWRWRNHPDTMHVEDWRRLAGAHDALLLAVERFLEGWECGEPRELDEVDRVLIEPLREALRK